MSAITQIRCARRIAIAAVLLLGLLDTAGARASISRSHALAEARLARAAGPAAGKLLAGLTKQGAPVVIGVARNQKHISVLAVLEMSCTSGNVFLTEDYWPRLSVASNGSVRGAQALAPSGSVTGGAHSIAGSLNRKHGKFAAVMRLQLNFAFSNGQTDSCDSGNVLVAAIL